MYSSFPKIKNGHLRELCESRCCQVISDRTFLLRWNQLVHSWQLWTLTVTMPAPDENITHFLKKKRKIIIVSGSGWLQPNMSKEFVVRVGFLNSLLGSVPACIISHGGIFVIQTSDLTREVCLICPIRQSLAFAVIIQGLDSSQVYDGGSYSWTSGSRWIEP